MKIQRLRLEQVRQFRSPIEITALEDGLNILTGPNESGKSTLARAIRAAFFERYKTTAVKDLSPWGDSGAAPCIELDFSVDGTAYALVKTFIKSPRCDLRVGARSLNGEEAENHLSALLGFQFAGKGGSKPEHWGIPGLLWIEQGAGHAVHDEVHHAVDHLRSALQTALGEVASSDGDEILEAIRAKRDVLLTAKGKPRGDYEKSIAQYDELTAKHRELQQRIEQYQQQVDQLDSLLAQQADDEEKQPWRVYQAQQTQAEASRASLRTLEQSLNDDKRSLVQAETTLKLVQDSLAAHEDKLRECQQRQLACVDLAQRMASLDTQTEQFKRQKDLALSTLQRAKTQARMARDAAERERLLERLATLNTERNALLAHIAACEALQQKISELRTLLVGFQLEPERLEALRQQTRALRENRIRQEAVATRLEFDLLAGVSISLDGAEITAQAERRIIQACEMVIPAVGHIRVLPGGGDLETLAAQQREIDDLMQANLQRLGVGSLDEAEVRALKQQQLQTEVKTYERDLSHAAPQGVDGLRRRLTECATQLQSVEAMLSRLPALAEGEVALGMDAAERELEQAMSEEREASHRVQQAAILRASSVAELEAAQHEIRRLEAALADSAQAERLRDANARLVATKAEMSVLVTAIERQQSELSLARADILDQDIARYRKSAEYALKQRDERKLDIARLQAQLYQAGAQGLEEEQGELSNQLEHAERRMAEFERRANALDWLKTTLEGKRHDLTKSLQAPLQKHLNKYLQLLFPGASMAIDDTLAPGALQRGAATSTFDELSFGAREQMGLMSRLAYADLLKEAGKPTLIVLDDVLVHSDGARLQAMKRVLNDAATRHQILLLTCHPEDWGDMGVALRGLAQLKMPSA